MESIALKAMLFAREAHKGIYRRYTNDPYVIHLAEVTAIAMSVGWHRAEIHPDKFMAVCWLHDVVEDTDVTIEEVEQKFGFTVAVGVSGLTDVEEGNRATRKRLARDRLGSCSGWIQTIKVADIISNTASIYQHDPKFATVYMEEARLLLGVLTKADPNLLAVAKAGLEN